MYYATSDAAIDVLFAMFLVVNVRLLLAVARSTLITVVFPVLSIGFDTVSIAALLSTLVVELIVVFDMDANQ